MGTLNAALRLAGAMLAIAGSIAAGSWATLHMPRPTPTPAPCYILYGAQGAETGTAPHEYNATMPSGDAAMFNDGVERVCTDGAWVKVSHYGN